MISDKDLKRFFAKVENGESCWEWVGAKSASGYGVFSLNGRHHGAHRVSYAIHNPETAETIFCQKRPDGMKSEYVLHSCDNRSCVNPDHLRLGTAQENMNDMVERKRKDSMPRKLSPEDVREIRALAADWDGICDMMKKHKIGQSALMDVVKRVSYKHVE